MPVRVNVKHFSLPARVFLVGCGFCRWFWGCCVPAKKYVHNSHQARNAQAQFIERFLPKDSAVTDAEEQRNDERVPVRVQ
jgi:hypothetical protein